MNTAAHDAHPLEGQHCLAVQDLTSDHRVGYNAECWPENYFALFDNEWGELNGAPRSGNEGSASTAAFPGDKCLAGWTVACTTTITAGGGDIDSHNNNNNNNRNGSKNENAGNEKVPELYPQAWCCPPGQWTCATATAEGDRQAPQRLCQSYLTGSTSTDIWMYWDPEFDTETPDGSTSSLFEAYTWTADVPGEPDPTHAATVFRKVFPLVLSSSAGAGPGTNPGLGAGTSETSTSASTSTSTAAVVVVTVTEVVTLEPTPRMPSPVAARDKRTEPVAGLLPPGGHLLTSRCLAAVLLGAAFATAVMSVFGFALLYRGKRRRREPRYRKVFADNTVSKASLDDAGKCEVGILFQPREMETS